MKFSVFQVSRKGGRVKNEDRMGYCYTRESGLFVLADGMGGHPEGEVAAQIALQTVAALYQREARPMVKEPKAFLAESAMAAHQQIMRYASSKAMLDTPRTTVVAAVLQAGMATWMHCGDSRLYVVRDGRLLVRTLDHSHAERPRHRGVSESSPANRNLLLTCLGSPTTPLFDVSAPLALQRERGRHVEQRRGGRTEAGEQQVAVGGRGLGHATVARALGMRMVERAHQQAAVAHDVQARVAAMHPGGHAGLQHGRDDGGARRVEHGLAAGVTHDLLVRGHRRFGEEGLGLLHHRTRLALVERGHGLQRDLRGHLALGMAAHAVGQHEQARFARVAVAHAVFVLDAAALAADLEDGKLHGRVSRRARIEEAMRCVFMPDGSSVPPRGARSSCRRSGCCRSRGAPSRSP